MMPHQSRCGIVVAGYHEVHLDLDEPEAVDGA